MSTVMTLNLSEINRGTEIRHLPASVRRQLADMMNYGDLWKDLAAVARNPDSGEPALLPQQIPSLASLKNPTEELLKHWSTLGRTRRLNVADLLDALEEAKLLRAADFIICDVLKASPEPRDYEATTTEVLANLTVSERGASADTADVNTIMNNPNMPHSHVTPDNVAPFLPIPQYTYLHLRQVTSNFSDDARLGEGAFGTVYCGKLAHGQLIAIKRMKSSIERQFVTELEIMCKFSHENLLPLIGYCFDGPLPCLVYAYMSNGSLEDRLACVNNTPAIPWETRVAIAAGVAEGLHYLHTFHEGPLVHRDVKSANILLDDGFVPKIGDFGLIRIDSSGEMHTVCVTKTALGTPAFMAPEAGRGDVSVKLDVFSFGVVIFEIISALPAYDPSREEADLLSFILEEEKKVEDILDNKGGDWDKDVASSLFELAQKCTEFRKRSRPTMLEVLNQLRTFVQQ